MTDQNTPRSEIVLYQTEDGHTRVQCRFEDETIWLSQKLMAELFQRDVRTVNEHIQNIFDEGELTPDSVIRKFRITAADGKSYAGSRTGRTKCQEVVSGRSGTMRA